MKPQQIQIAAFISLYKQSLKYLNQDVEALNQLKEYTNIAQAMQFKFKYYFEFYQEYENNRKLKAKELNKTNKTGETNQILQREDELFWFTLTEQRQKVFYQLVDLNQSQFYCQNIRSIIPGDVVEEVNKLVKIIPAVPMSKEEYIMKKLSEKQQ
ncbi:Hypothetical_protein [Hexamita inflata]|uniref:Hypothetical_protein n=1 Tax=Hexamita inflata TaxID=28002 RepID=A0AA86ND32_9EUKA|nr:Hypothetical protein HINF_LOCUS5167 [Hexamita inflata]